jgi:hypothetical protein
LVIPLSIIFYATDGAFSITSLEKLFDLEAFPPSGNKPIAAPGKIHCKKTARRVCIKFSQYNNRK